MLNVLLALLLVAPSVSPRRVVYNLARDLALKADSYARCQAPAARARAETGDGYGFLTLLSYRVAGEPALIRNAVNRRARRRALTAVGAWRGDAGSRWRDFKLNATPGSLYQIVVAPRGSGANVCFNLYVKR